MEIEKGDKVRFTTGTNPMTVDSIDDDYVNCTWSSRLGAEMKGSIPIHLLTKIEDTN